MEKLQDCFKSRKLPPVNSHTPSHIHTPLWTQASSCLPSHLWVGVVITLLSPCFISWTDGRKSRLLVHTRTHTVHSASLLCQSCTTFCVWILPARHPTSLKNPGDIYKPWAHTRSFCTSFGKHRHWKNLNKVSHNIKRERVWQSQNRWLLGPFIFIYKQCACHWENWDKRGFYFDESGIRYSSVSALNLYEKAEFSFDADVFSEEQWVWA